MSNPQFPPAGACDCHVHVVGPKQCFAFAKPRSYTPMDAPLPALRNHLDRLGLDRVVLVQPSFYGADNSCMLAALTELGPRARGVGVVDADITAAELDRLHQAGVRGLRLNMASLGSTTDAAVTALLHDTAKLCRRNGWHIQLFIHASSIVPLASTLRKLDVPVVIDHFGLLNPADQESAAICELIELLASGHVFVKLSAPYRIAAAIDDPAIDTLARRLAESNPAHVVWGSDWPHTPVHKGVPVHDNDVMQYRDIDTALSLRLMWRWFPQADQRHAVLVDNAARLYDFAASAPGAP